METKNLIIACIWAFVMLSIVVIFFKGGMEFVGYLILFSIALIASLIVAYAMPEKK